MQGGSSTASSAAAAAAAAAAMFQGMRPPQFPEPEQQQLKCPRCESTNTKFCYYNNYNLSQPRHFCKSCRRYWTKGGSLRNIPVGGGTRKNSTKRSKNGTSGEESDSNNNGNATPTATATAKTDGNPAKRANNNTTTTTTTTTTNDNSHHTNSASSTLTNPIQPQTAPAPAALTSADPPSSLPKPELLPPIYPSGEQEPRMFESFSSLLSSAPHFANLMSIPSLSGHHPLDLGTLSSTPHFGGCEDVAPAAPPPPAEEDFLNLQGDPGCWSTGDRSAGGGSRGGGWPGLSIYPPDSDFH